MRSTFKDIEYYRKYIEKKLFYIKRGFAWIEEGKVNDERMSWFKKDLFSKYLDLVIAQYSSGAPIKQLIDNYQDALNYVNEAWFDDLTKAVGGDPHGSVVLNQYFLSSYDEMLWMLSLGYLLNVSELDFKKLVEVVDKDNVKDNLFEFIISAKIKDRALISEESYKEFFGIPEVFSKLREAIKESNKTKAEILIKDFLENHWYKNHENAGWYNSHKSKHDTYFGYWSFESAAVVKIMGLDDSSFRDNQYYPKDLVHV